MNAISIGYKVIVIWQGNDAIVLSAVHGRIIRSPINMKQLALDAHRMNT